MRKYDSNHDFLPAGPRALALAVIATGLEDAKKGARGSRDWLDSRDFEYWCDLVDLNPDYIRRQVAPHLPPPGQQRPKRPRQGVYKKGNPRKFTPDELAKVVAIHNAGHTWQVAASAIGTSFRAISPALRQAGIQTNTRTDREGKPK